MPASDPIWRFNPSRTDPDVREKIFVQRKELADNLMERIRDSALTGNRHHLLLIGPRGIGKTHLVALLRHRIEDDSEIRDRLRVAWLNEDESSTSFLELLLRILRALGNEYPDEFNASLEAVYEIGPSAAEAAATQLLLKQLGTHTLLVILENLDDLFSGLGDEGQKRWRSFLQEHSVTATLATAQQIFKGVKKRDNPFFGFFQIEYLKPLTVSEAVELLSKVAEVHDDPDLLAFLQTTEGRARVRALHHLSGGNHRIYVVLSEIINHESLDALVPAFEKMLDELTPYYQERLRSLSSQQRRIVEFLCTCERPIPVKEIAKRLFMTEQTAASQLKTLKELRYVISHSRGRESLYELTEPLMRLSFEVKENRRGPVRLIVDFLRVWYRSDQLEDRLSQLDPAAIREREHLENAIILARSSKDPRLVAIQEDLAAAEREGRLDEIVLIMEEQTHVENDSCSWFDLGFCQYKLKRYDAALASCEKVLEINPNDTDAWVICTYALSELKQDEEALATSATALTINPKSPHLWLVRGTILCDLKRYQESFKCFDKALEIDPNYASAYNSRGIALREMERYEESLACFEKALAIDPNNASAYNSRGIALHEMEQYEEALTCYDRALEIDPSYANAWGNRGRTFGELKKFDEELASYDTALEIDPHNSNVWNNRGYALRELKRYDEAVESYDKAIAIDSSNCYPKFNRVNTLWRQGRWKEGFSALQLTIESFWPNEHDFAGSLKDMITTIASSTTRPEEWKDRTSRLIAIYSERNLVRRVGDGLVRSLAKLDVKMLSEAALDAWWDVWFEVGKDYDELELPLRIFAVGIQYLKTQDLRVLFDLIQTERRILEEALGLTPAES